MLHRLHILHILHVLVAGVVAGTLAVIGLTAGARANDVGDTEQSKALGDFGACMLSQQRGAVVFLIDQSGSLRETDPQKNRVKAGQYLVKRFDSFAAKAGVQLDIRVAGFSANYDPQGSWTVLSQSTIGAVSTGVRTVGDDIHDYDTDYWNALEFARQDLDDHAGQGDECKAIVWVTDGDYDIDPRESADARSLYGDEKTYAPGVSLNSEQGAAKALKAGKADMCRDSGLVDQIRSSGITLLGIGLTQGSPDFSFVKSVILGGGQNAGVNGVAQCGAQDSPRGSFSTVDDLDSLYMAFDSISTPGQTASSQQIGICQGEVCSDREATFVLDDSIGAVHIMASSDHDGLDAYLVPPGDGENLKLGAGTSGTAGSTGIPYSWLTNRTLEFDLDPTAVPTWSGVWKVMFVDSSSSSDAEKVRVNLHLSTSAILEWKGLSGTELRSGDQVEGVTLQVLNAVGGQVVKLNSLRGDVAVNVSITDQAGDTAVLFDSTDKAAIDTPVAVDLKDVVAGPAKVSTSLQITTAPATLTDGTRVEGTRLTPTVSTTSVYVDPPASFPRVSGTVDFGLLESEQVAQADVEVTGPGCAWVNTDDTVLTGVPSGAGVISVTSEADEPGTCVSADEGNTVQLPLTLTVDDAANGALTGSVAVSLAPMGRPEDAQTVVLPFTADMRKPLDAPLAWVTFFAAVLLGVGLPIAALYLFKFMAAKVPAGTLVSAVVPVTIAEDEYEAATIEVNSSDLVISDLGKATREVSIGEYDFHCRMGIMPAQPGRVDLTATAPSVSSGTPGSKAGHAVLPLGMRGHWVAVLDRADSPQTVSLILLSASADPSSLEKILSDARTRVGDAVRSVQSRLETIGDDGPDSREAEPEEGAIFRSALFGEDSPSPFSFGNDDQSAFGDFGTSDGSVPR